MNKHSNIDTLVFAGGGMRCLAYLGALHYLYESGTLRNVHSYAGTSAGSIVALLTACGYTPRELVEVAKTFNYDKLKSIDLFSIASTYGIESFVQIQRFIQKLIKAKTGVGTMTFKELHTVTGNKLYINAVCVNTNSTEIFSTDTTPDMSIVTAMRLSLTLPFIISANTYNGKIYTDGGIKCNFLLHLFDPKSTLGMKTSSPEQTDYVHVSDIATYGSQIYKCIYDDLFNHQRLNSNENLYSVVDIQCTTSIASLDLSRDAKVRLCNMGYNVCKKYLASSELQSSDVILNNNLNPSDIIND